MALRKRAWRWRKRAWRGAIVKVARGNTKSSAMILPENTDLNQLLQRLITQQS